MPSSLRNATTIVFLSIVVLTAISALLSNLGIGGLDPNSNFAKTTLGLVLVEIVGAVIIGWKAGILTPTTISAVIEFSGQDSGYINLDLASCTYEIRDVKAKVKSTGRLNIVWGFAGWECKFPSPNDLDDSIMLRLQEKKGKKWEVRPFYPLSRGIEEIENLE